MSQARTLDPTRWLGVPLIQALVATVLFGIPIRIWGLQLPEPIFPMPVVFAWAVIRPSVLAPMGIRYVVVVQRLAPAPFATRHLPAPRGFVATLDAQLDLEPLDVPAGLTVYRNHAAFPVRAAIASALPAARARPN